MGRFEWISDGTDLPPRWDLRELGWQLCDSGPGLGPGPQMGLKMGQPDGPAGTCPLLCDYQAMSAAYLATLKSERQRMILLGVEGSIERAGLLAAQFGDALPSNVELHELSERASRIAASVETMPRYHNAGPVLLDLFHRDGSANSRWLGLHPREFALLWYLAERPGMRVSRRQLLTDVWRLDHEPGTNRVEVHISRLRGKLSGAGLGYLVETDPQGGYRLGGSRMAVMAPQPTERAAALDDYVRLGVPRKAHQEEQ